MQRQSPFIVLAFVVATLFVGVRAAAACDCHGAGPVCEEFWKTPVVFSGRVISVTPIKSTTDDEPLFRNRFRVTEAFRGTTAGSTVDVFSGSDNCSHFFKAGENWIIYAFSRSDVAGLGTSTCSRTQRLKPTTPDLEYLRTVYSRKSDKGSITGQLKYASTERYYPVPGVRVTLSRQPSEQLIATTDAEGRYQVSGWPGSYRVTAALPAGMSLMDEDVRVELLDSRGCAVGDLHASYPGTIEGRVVSASGAPIPNIAVEMIGANGQRHWDSRGLTDARGRYEISGLRPGDYRPAVAIGWTEVSQGVRGTYVFEGGETIEQTSPKQRVAGGSRSSVKDIVLPKTTRIVQVSGMVVRADGRPAAGIKIGAKADVDDWSALWTTVQTDPRGRFVFAMIAGERYRVVVEPGAPTSQRTTVYVDPAKPTAPLRLVLKD